MAICYRILVLGALARVSADDNTDMLQLGAYRSEKASPEAVPSALLSSQQGESMAIADVSSILSQPEAVMNDLASGVAALEKKMVEMKSENEMKLASQSDIFKKRLEEFSANNAAIANKNDAIQADIGRLTTDNLAKRAAAQDLSKANAALVEDLQKAMGELQTATEFVDKSIKDGTDDKNGPELKVLAELDQADAEAGAIASHQGAIDEISAFGAHRQLGMLDISPPKSMPAADDIVASLEKGLQEFSKEAKEGEEQLKAHFLESFKVESVRQTELTKKQASLLATRDHLQNLETRLSAAVEHLTKTHTSLQEQIKSVQGFVLQNLGNVAATQDANAGGISLLETSVHHRQKALGLSSRLAAARPLQSFGEEI